MSARGGDASARSSARMISARSNGSASAQQLPTMPPVETQQVPMGSARSVASSHRSRSQPHQAWYYPSVGHFSITCIPGYGGFVPGKVAENVIASTFARSNSLAALACDERGIENYDQFSYNPLRYNPGGIDHPSRSIPGYGGFVPGKYADGVFGHVFGRANNISTLVKQKQYNDRQEWVQRLAQKAA